MSNRDQAVAIVGGTGDLGGALALQLARAGVQVRIGSRKTESAEAAANEINDKLAGTGAKASGHANAEAVQGVEVVFVTVPFAGQAENLKQLKDDLREGQIVVDATVPLATAIGGKPTQTIGVWHGSAAQQAQALVPVGVRVVSALHSVSAGSLGDLENAHEQDVLVMGAKKADKARVATLIDLIPGLRAVDGGPLEAAQIAEQITALLIGINIRYKTHAGVRFTDLPERSWE